MSLRINLSAGGLDGEWRDGRQRGAVWRDGGTWRASASNGTGGEVVGVSLRDPASAVRRALRLRREQIEFERLRPRVNLASGSILGLSSGHSPAPPIGGAEVRAEAAPRPEAVRFARACFELGLSRVDVATEALAIGLPVPSDGELAAGGYDEMAGAYPSGRPAGAPGAGLLILSAGSRRPPIAGGER